MRYFYAFMAGIAFVMAIISYSDYCQAATRCERDNSGGICCWDTNVDGPFKPISCE